MTQAQAPTDPALLDAARRIADEMTLHAIAGSEGWCPFWLADGRPVTRGTFYEKRTDAVRAAKWDRDNVIYLEIQPGGMKPEQAVQCLQFARALHGAGFRIPSPEFEFDPTMPLMAADRVKTIRHLASGGGRFPLRRG